MTKEKYLDDVIKAMNIEVVQSFDRNRWNVWISEAFYGSYKTEKKAFREVKKITKPVITLLMKERGSGGTP